MPYRHRVCIKHHLSGCALLAQRWPRDISLIIDLGKETQHREEGNTGIGKPNVRRLAAHGVHLRSSAPWGNSQQKSRFPDQVLKIAGPDGFERSLGKAARTNSRQQAGVIMCGMPLVCWRPFIQLLIEGSRLKGAPWTNACLC